MHEFTKKSGLVEPLFLIIYSNSGDGKLQICERARRAVYLLFCKAAAPIRYNIPVLVNSSIGCFLGLTNEGCNKKNLKIIWEYQSTSRLSLIHRNDKWKLLPEQPYYECYLLKEGNWKIPGVWKIGWIFAKKIIPATRQRDSLPDPNFPFQA